MNQKIMGCILGAGFLLGGCAAAREAPTTAARSYAGWYMEHGAQGTFQPCGHAPQLLVTGSADLRARARKFGLDEDMPVYVRLFGVVSADRGELKVSRVEQFGSPTPIRNCAMNGVVTPAPPSTKR